LLRQAEAAVTLLPSGASTSFRQLLSRSGRTNRKLALPALEAKSSDPQKSGLLAMGM